MATGVGSNGIFILSASQGQQNVNGAQLPQQNVQNQAVNGSAHPRRSNSELLQLTAERALGQLWTFVSPFFCVENTRVNENRNLYERVTGHLETCLYRGTGIALGVVTVAHTAVGLPFTAIITAIASIAIFRADYQMHTSAALQERINDLSALVANYANNNDQLRIQIDTLQESNTSLERSLVTLGRENQNLQSTADTLRNETQKYQTQNRELEALIENSDRTLIRARGVLEELDNQRMRANADLGNTTQKLGETERNLQNVAKQLDQAKDDFRQTTEKQQKLTIAIQKVVDELSVGNGAFAKNLRQLNASIECLTLSNQEAIVSTFIELRHRLPESNDGTDKLYKMAHAIMNNPNLLRLIVDQMKITENVSPTS